MAISPTTTAPNRTPTAESSARASKRGGEYLAIVFGFGLSKYALDVTRSAIKLPEAERSGRLLAGLAQTIVGSPTRQLIDPRAPAIATAASHGRSFTALDASLYRTAAFLGVGLGVFQAYSGVSNIVAAVHKGGASAVIDSRRGRAGLFQTSSAAITLGTFGGAMGAARIAGVRGPVATAVAAATSGTLASPIVLGGLLVSTGLFVANERGFLDFFNRGDSRSVGQVQRDAWKELDVAGKYHRMRGVIGLDS